MQRLGNSEDFAEGVSVFMQNVRESLKGVNKG